MYLLANVREAKPHRWEANIAPENPRQHVQVKLPGKLLHVLFAPQLSVFLTHSLMSMSQCGPSYLQRSRNATRSSGVCILIFNQVKYSSCCHLASCLDHLRVHLHDEHADMSLAAV